MNYFRGAAEIVLFVIWRKYYERRKTYLKGYTYKQRKGYKKYIIWAKTNKIKRFSTFSVMLHFNKNHILAYN